MIFKIILALLIPSAVAATEGPQDVLIHLKAKADLSGPRHLNYPGRGVFHQLKRVADESQGLVVDLLKDNGIEYRTFYIANAVFAKHVSAQLIEKLRRLPEVASVHANHVSKMNLPTVEYRPTLRASDIPDQIRALNVDKVWAMNITGKGLVIGSIDSGVFWGHEAIRARYRGTREGAAADHEFNWHDTVREPFAETFEPQVCPYDSAEPCDDVDHGTHTVGTMVGEQKGRDRFGVAFDAQWIGCRGLDRGYGSTATYLECLEYFLAPYPRGTNPRETGRPDRAPNIINVSWICGVDEGCKTGSELHDAVRALKAAGILIVASAGNDGPQCSTVMFAPGGYSRDVLTVAAYDHRNGEIAEFSSRGPSTLDGGLTPQITAPGVFLRSSIPGGGGYSDYGYKSGTSMAAPHISGLVALLWSAKPELKGRVDETIAWVQKTAQPRMAAQTCGNFPGRAVPNAVWGYGIADALAAVQSTSSE